MEPFQLKKTQNDVDFSDLGDVQGLPVEDYLEDLDEYLRTQNGDSLDASA